MIRRWLKFNAVGAIGIVVQLGALAILKGLLRVQYLPGDGPRGGDRGAAQFRVARALDVAGPIRQEVHWDGCCASI